METMVTLSTGRLVLLPLRHVLIPPRNSSTHLNQFMLREVGRGHQESTTVDTVSV